MSENLLSYLREIFPGSEAITLSQFRGFLNLSPSKDWRMRKSGHYPRVISLSGSSDVRILLPDLAKWLEQGGSRESSPKKRGRPAGSRNKPKNPAQDSPTAPGRGIIKQKNNGK